MIITMSYDYNNACDGAESCELQGQTYVSAPNIIILLLPAISRACLSEGRADVLR